MLVIWYRPAADSEARIEAIRSAYKAPLRPGERDARRWRLVRIVLNLSSRQFAQRIPARHRSAS